MYHLVLLFAAAALLSGGCKSANVNRHMKLLADMDNRIQSNPVKTSQTKRFVTLTRRPPAHVTHQAGRTLELTCEAIGAPAPSVHWFKNDAPVYEYDKESNEVIDTNPTSVARVSSTLLVARADAPATYTCLAVAGAKTARAVSTVYSSDGSAEVSERARLAPLAPRVLVSYKVFVDTIGSGVALPCRARGHPRPAVTWRDNTGAPVKDPRMTVLRSGELVISSLQWSDMGEFTCHASNMFGSTEIKTFVYPARPNDADR